MPALRQITGIINTALQAGNFSSRRFQGGSWHELAYLLPTQNEDGSVTYRPAIVPQDGDAADMVANDANNILVYHRNTALAYVDAPNEDFGDPGNFIQEVADMLIVFSADRNRLKADPEEIAAAIVKDMPVQIDHATLASLNLISCIIEPGDVNVNPIDVWNVEYNGTPYTLNTSGILLSIKYKITTIYAKCFQLCQT